MHAACWKDDQNKAMKCIHSFDAKLQRYCKPTFHRADYMNDPRYTDHDSAFHFLLSARPLIFTY